MWLRWCSDEQAVGISGDEPAASAYTRVLPLRSFLMMEDDLQAITTIEAHIDEDTSGLCGLTLDPDGANVHVCMSGDGLSEVCHASDAETLPGIRRVMLRKTE